MGLDMFLIGERSFSGGFDDKPKLISERYLLGYWRKHPNLHGYIVQEFSEGDDNCRENVLSDESLRQIIAAVENDQLPVTTGFFFGESDGSEKERDLQILRDAVTWLETPDEHAWRYVTYQASW